MSDSLIGESVAKRARIEEKKGVEGFSVGELFTTRYIRRIDKLNLHFKAQGNCIVQFSETEYGVIKMKDGSILTEAVIANIVTKRIILYKMKKSIITKKTILSVTEQGILDNTSNGERWEGMIRNGEACGWGCYYSSQNELSYEGLYFRDHKSVYGEEYYPVLGTLQYVGTFLHNKRHGYGKLLSNTGETIYEGFFIHGIPDLSVVLSDEKDCNKLYSVIERLHIGIFTRVTLFRSQMHMNCFTNLKEVWIEKDFIQQMNSIHFLRMASLEKIVVGSVTGSLIDNSMKNMKLFYVSECPRLKEITIGNHGLGMYARFILESRLSVISLSNRM